MRSSITWRAARSQGFEPLASLVALEKALNSWYQAHQRERSAQVFWRQHGHEYWFYIRHAQPIKRDGCVDKDLHSGSMIYRPERHDVVIYDTEAGELRVHADCEQEPELFRLTFGMHLFGDHDYFPASKGRYTLDPLKRGRGVLACAGIDGLLHITLRELEFRGHGELGLRERVSAADVFRIFEARRYPIPAAADIRLARFSVMFRDTTKPRSFTIRPSNFATFSRDDDAVPLHAWLSGNNLYCPSRRRLDPMSRGVWNTLDRLAGGQVPVAALTEWRRLAKGDFPLLGGFLRVTQRLAGDYPCLADLDCGCRHELVQCDDTRRVRDASAGRAAVRQPGWRPAT